MTRVQTLIVATVVAAMLTTGMTGVMALNPAEAQETDDQILTSSVESASLNAIPEESTNEGENETNTSVTVGEPIALESQPNFECTGACEVTNTTTLLLGGEPTARTITVEQGDTQYEVTPLSNNQTIEEFYSYSSHEINAPLPIAKSNTSRLFFWSGPDGLSLVLLHDKDDKSGGAVTMEFDGLPTDEGQWVVKDGPSSDFQSETHWDWSWTGENTDGGAFRGGLSNQTVTIHPAFNEEAARTPLESGTIERWEVLTGQATEPRNESLALNQPVTLSIPEGPIGNDTNDTGTATWTHNLTESDCLTISYEAEQTGVDPSVTLTITDEDGNTITKSLKVSTVGTVQESVDLTELAGENATVKISVDGVDLSAEFAPCKEVC